MKKVLFLFFLSFIICDTGSYVRRSFKENSAEIDVTYKVAEKAAKSFYRTYLEKSSNFSIYPLSVFSQVVKGTNFKYVFASLENNGRLTILTATIYLDLDNTAPQFKNVVVAEEIVEKDELEEVSKMEDAIKKVYKNEIDGSSTISGFKNILFENAGDSLYFVKINSQKKDYALVYKDSEGNYNIDYIIKNFRMIYA